MGERERRTKQQERAERILDVASELLLRWGYKRVTIEDIARQADVGTGTIYLHWKNKEAIFEHVMLREAVAVWRELLQRINTDPQEVLVHRIMRSMFLIVKKRPLAQALFTRDSTLPGKLSQGDTTKQVQNQMNAQEFIKLLRDFGLLRTDSSLPIQAYALGATISGFTLIDPLPGEEDQVSLEEKADAMAQTIRLAFEPEVLPTSVLLQERVVPLISQILEQICEYCEQQIRERMAR
jgi:AcrR family transcriptional regulator